MPLIDIQVLAGVFSEDEKAQLIRETAKAFGTVAGKQMQDNTSVRIHEIRSGHWGGEKEVWTTENALKLKNAG